jgi:archaellum biogenesis protein FlaJ (TadC family)
LFTMFWPDFSIKIRAYVEMIVSFFLMMLFGMAVVLITGIGGPGQSVGDMYYSVWLCFFVTIWLALTCLKQIQEADDTKENQEGETNQMSTIYSPPVNCPPSTWPGRPPLPPIM